MRAAVLLLAVAVSACSASRGTSERPLQLLDRLSIEAESALAQPDTSRASSIWAEVATRAATSESGGSETTRLILCAYARRAYSERLNLPWPPPTVGQFNIRGPAVSFYLDGELLMESPEASWERAVAAHGCQ